MFESHGDSLWGQLMEYLDRSIRYVILNLAWLFLTLPFVVIFFLILRYLFDMQTYPWVLLSIPVALASPAIGGLFYATNQLAHSKSGGLDVFWEGVKTYAWPSYRWGVLNLLAAFIVSVNIWFYGNLGLGIAPYLRIAFIIFSVFWAVLQIYIFPLLIEQEKPHLKMAFRNSLIALARFPLQSLGMLILIALIVVISTFVFPLFWFLITVSLIAYLSNRFTLFILKRLLVLEKENAKTEGE